MSRNSKNIEQQLKELGVNVRPSSHFIESTEPMTMCASRVSDLSKPVTNSGEVPCDTCKELVWLAPSSQEILIERFKRGLVTKVFCTPCILSITKLLNTIEKQRNDPP